MNREEIIVRRLLNQHLTSPAGTEEIVRDLIGIQSQYENYALPA